MGMLPLISRFTTVKISSIGQIIQIATISETLSATHQEQDPMALTRSHTQLQPISKVTFLAHNQDNLVVDLSWAQEGQTLISISLGR